MAIGNTLFRLDQLFDPEKDMDDLTFAKLKMHVHEVYPIGSSQRTLFRMLELERGKREA